MGKIIKARNVSKVYNPSSNVSKIALQDINLDIETGAFACVMGTSGSGKTTLLNILSTIDNPTSGKVFLFDKNISTLSDKEKANIRKQEISFIFQDYNLIESLPVKDNILFSLRLHKVDLKTQEKEFYKIIKILNIEDIIEKYPFECSGGQKQRVAIARALITGAKIVFADEPTGNLDSLMTKELMELFVNINTTFVTTIIMVTHDCYVASFSKEMYYVEDGKIMTHLVKGNLLQEEYYNQIIQVALYKKF